ALAGERDRGDAKTCQIGDGIAEIAKFGHNHGNMTAAHRAVGNAGQHKGDGGRDAGTARNRQSLGRSQTTAQKTHGTAATKVQAQRNTHAGAPRHRRRAGHRAHGCAIGHRLSEASSTIHRTSSSNVMPAWIASSGTSWVSVMPG